MADFVKPTPVSELFGASIQLIVPRFQRKYEWSCAKPDDEIPTLWDDIVQACEDGRDHYIGAIVIMPDTAGTDIRKYFLIDGQQRWTTLSILFRVLHDYITVVNNTNYPNICRQYVIDDNYGVHKLIRSVEGDDYARLIDSINNEDPYTPRKTCSERCFQFFSSKLKEIKENETEKLNIVRLFNTLKNHIKIVMITVSDEDPCVIFESLNNTGRKLTSISMIRNYVMLKCAALDLTNDVFQDQVYNNYWIPFERLADGDETKLGEYLRVHLMMSGTRVTKSEMYHSVKSLVDKTTCGVRSAEEMKTALSQVITPWIEDYGLYKVAIGDELFQGSSKNSDSIRRSLEMIKECGFKSPRNYILKALIKNKTGNLSIDDLATVLRIVESYIVRRTLYRDLLNNTVDLLFLELCRDDIFEPRDVYDRIMSEAGAGMWPSNEDLRMCFETKDFYSEDRRHFCISVLTRIDTHLANGKESIESNQTNEHIFPQTADERWKEYCGEDYQYMYEHTHRLGNMTLLDSSHNSENSNKLYDEKKPVYSGSRYVITNKIPKDYEMWDKEAFIRRQNILIEEIQTVWSSDYEVLSKKS